MANHNSRCLVEIPAALASINAAIGITKAIRDIEKKYDAATLKAAIADLTSALADAKLGLVELREQIEGKEAEITALKEAFDIKTALVAGPDGFDYLPGDDGQPSGAPACPQCLQAHHKIIFTHQKKGFDVACPVYSTAYSPVVVFPHKNGTGYEAWRQATLNNRRNLSRTSSLA